MAQESKRVLVVDDDLELASMVELLLSEFGFRAVCARNGLEALAQVSRQMPDIILLDMRMPRMDGWEFAREFRARYDHRARIVVLTAGSNPKKTAQEIGAEGYVGKPFAVNDLIDIVARL